MPWIFQEQSDCEQHLTCQNDSKTSFADKAQKKKSKPADESGGESDNDDDIGDDDDGDDEVGNDDVGNDDVGDSGRNEIVEEEICCDDQQLHYVDPNEYISKEGGNAEKSTVVADVVVKTPVILSSAAAVAKVVVKTPAILSSAAAINNSSTDESSAILINNSSIDETDTLHGSAAVIRQLQPSQPKQSLKKQPQKQKRNEEIRSVKAKRIRTQKIGFPIINPELLIDENDAVLDSEIEDSEVNIISIITIIIIILNCSNFFYLQQEEDGEFSTTPWIVEDRPVTDAENNKAEENSSASIPHWTVEDGLRTDV